ncbi:PPOX class F420-dependent oxidoreductase [Actinomycetospora sp. CA-101289]|uniref:PPOX class F420-dependent oxidoreductase n=1 Tax=Actinomycetospora sp. CA-101289 TaxID=3239893 RepID=UPI003D99479B
MTLPDDLTALLRRPAPCFISTLMPDGSPQMTQTWVDTDGDHILINTVESHQKVRNIARDPRVALNVADPDRPARYFGVRGRVIDRTTEGGDAHIDALSQRYLGRPYPAFGGPDQVRVILTIAADRITNIGY